MSQFLRYSNPVWDGYCADPFVLLHDSIYYAYGTSCDEGDIHMGGRHFVLLRSPDLVNWEFLGGALEPAPGLEKAAHWAPEVAFSGGKFWMYYSAEVSEGEYKGLQRLRVAVADHPAGPFKDTGRLLFPREGFTIDASPFQDPKDGRWYLYFSKDYFDGRVGTGTAVVPLADDMVTPLAEPIPVVVASTDWHISARDKHNYDQHWAQWHTVEGAHVVFRDGIYYCFYSGGAWTDETYGVSYATADHPLGPWRDEWSQHGPLVLQTIPGEVVGPGHNSVVLAPDGETHVCVYHSWNAAHTKRQLCIDPIVWTQEGPIVHLTRQNGALPVGKTPVIA